MSRTMEGKRKPAGKNSKMTCAAMMGYGENLIEGKYGLTEVSYGKKRAPLSTELTSGVTIVAANGGNPKRQEER